ncbi:MAG: aminopeptidase [Firmicutes bacterium]|nr:aminopeptidase [Bacillota bacterium]
MRDERYAALAKQLVEYSVALQPGEKVLLEIKGRDEALTRELINAVYRRGGRPFVHLLNERVEKEWLLGADDQAMQDRARWEAQRMSEMDAYIGVRSKDNLYDMKGVDDGILDRYDKLFYKPVHYDIRVDKTKWVILGYPNDAMAQNAAMPTDEFEDFYFKVCCLDYAKFSKAMDPLKNLLDHADTVRIRGEGVDLRFRITGMPSVKCDGRLNIPDGEVFTAPVKDSVEGYITYNTPSPNRGQVFEGVTLRFSQGKIVEADCRYGDKKALQAIFDSDPGARYIGEFAFGLNPFIEKPMKDILFDEKILGSFHFTPGNCYKNCDNGNYSTIHWDMVYIMRPEYGGCEIYIDDELIEKDGVFVRKDLQALNRENFV